MKLIEFNGYKLYIEKSVYVYGNKLSLHLYAIDDGPYASMTINITDCELKEDEVILDVNNFPEVKDLMEKYKLGVFTDYSVQSGYCWYPIYKLNMEEVDKYCIH